MIVSVNIEDINTIRQIAERSWKIAYAEIISEVQFDYMINKFYSFEALKEAISEGPQQFILYYENNVPMAFASYQTDFPNHKQTKLHKLYVAPEGQGLGIGNKLINWIVDIALKQDSNQLILNVNKYNKAISFYQKMGFEILKPEVVEIGEGYIMDDYVMGKNI